MENEEREAFEALRTAIIEEHRKLGRQNYWPTRDLHVEALDLYEVIEDVQPLVDCVVRCLRSREAVTS